MLRHAPSAAALRRRLPRRLLARTLARHLGAFGAGLRETDGDRLLAALHLGMTAGAALQRAGLSLVHRALHALARGLAVLPSASALLRGHLSHSPERLASRTASTRPGARRSACTGRNDCSSDGRSRREPALGQLLWCAPL